MTCLHDQVDWDRYRRIFCRRCFVHLSQSAVHVGGDFYRIGGLVISFNVERIVAGGQKPRSREQ